MPYPAPGKCESGHSFEGSGGGNNGRKGAGNRAGFFEGARNGGGRNPQDQEGTCRDKFIMEKELRHITAMTMAWIAEELNAGVP